MTNEPFTCQFCNLTFPSSAVACLNDYDVDKCKHSPTRVDPCEVIALRPGDTVEAMVDLEKSKNVFVRTKLTGTVIGTSLANEVLIIHTNRKTHWVRAQNIISIEHTAFEDMDVKLLFRQTKGDIDVALSTPAMSYARKLLTLVLSQHGATVAEKVMGKAGLAHIHYLTVSNAPRLRAFCEDMLPGIRERAESDASMRQFLFSK